MRQDRVEVRAVRRLQGRCCGIRVGARTEHARLGGERSEDGLEEVACRERGSRDGDGGRGIDRA